MILAAAVLVAVLVGLLRGGSFRYLAGLPVRWGWLALVAFALQAYDIYFPEPKTQGLFSLRVGILLCSYLLIFAVAWQNRGLPGMWVIAAGYAANFIVMVLNGGYMPITMQALEQVGHAYKVPGAEVGARVPGTKDIVLPRELTTGWWLADIFVIASPFPIPSVFSPGDALIGAGVFWLIQSAMRGSYLSQTFQQKEG